MNATATWRFREMEQDQKHVEPTHREHLAPGGIVESLVRETIQNSLDVTLDGKVTKVLFTLGGRTPSRTKKYFATLWPHLKELTRSLPDGLPAARENVRFLAVEDHNTTGLVGDPSIRNEINRDGSKNHFFRFWHRVGPATEFKRRGSWGVGKVVFSNASRIRTFFGLTLRQGDSSALLMGEAGLTIHRLRGKVYDWYGYYARHQGRKGLVPILGVAASDFANVFGLSRVLPGLSILVPYVRDEVTLNALGCATVEQYLLPILEGHLEVTLAEGARRLEINRDTIDDIAKHLSWPSKAASSRDEVAAILRLARWQTDLREEDYTLLNPLGIDKRYILDKNVFPVGVLVQVSDSFATNKPVALRLPIAVHSKCAPVALEEVRIILERDEGLRTSNIAHLRSGINISKLRSQGPTAVRGLVVIGFSAEQGPLDRLLQTSEGPAHVSWEQQGEGYDQAKAGYEEAHRVIGLMRNLARNIVDLLSAPHEDRDTRTLSVFFPDLSTVGLASGPNEGNKRGSGPKDEGDPPPPPPGVIEGVVKGFVGGSSGPSPVEMAVVSLLAFGQDIRSILTDGGGQFRFEHLQAGAYAIAARKENVGEAEVSISLSPSAGERVELILRGPPIVKMFSKVSLEDGFAICGNPEFLGTLRPVRVRLAYAAWGGSKSYNKADFSLETSRLAVAFRGTVETTREQLIEGPNILRFTPLTPHFHVEVRGFDINRALHADARVVEDLLIDGDTDE